MVRPATDGRSRRTVLAVLFVALVALAGCNALQSPGDEEPSLPNASTAADRHAGVDGFRGTLNVTQRHEGNVSWTVQRIAVRPGTGDFRNEILATGPPPADDHGLGVGSLVVSNGSVRHLYAAESDRVFRSQVDDDRSRNRTREIRRLVAELRDGDNSTIRRPTPSLSPLPVVPAEGSAGNGSSAVQWREDDVTVSYRGTATVAGRTTHVIDMRPASDDASLVEATLWLDTEYFYPLKRHTVAYHYGERYEYTSVYRNVTFDPGFEPGTFRFDPDAVPANASTTESRSFDSRAEMVDALDRPVPDPEVPDRFGFADGFYSAGNITTVSLSYTTPDERETIRVTAFPDSTNLSADGRRVTVGGEPAVLERAHGNRYLQLIVNGRQVSITGTVGNETLRRVGASLVD